MSNVMRNSVVWPRSFRKTIEAIAVAFSSAYLVARSRVTSVRSKIVRLMSMRDSYRWQLVLLRRENALLRQRLERMPPQKRPQYSPEDRFAILQLMWLRRWSIKLTAKRLVLHHNTLGDWLRAIYGKRDTGLFFGSPPFNKASERVRWLVHEIRRLCPEREFGTRRIAAMIIRAGISLSRASVQRILREPKKCQPRPCGPSKRVDAFHILRPDAVNRTWHMDMTTLEFFICRFYVAAIVDGFSRKLLALRVFKDAPSSKQIFAMFRRTVGDSGTPRFLVTDHGCQFRKPFKAALKKLNKSLKSKFNSKPIELIKGTVDSKRFNGKAERFFRTFKIWKQMLVCAFQIGPIQRRLDLYRDWYNTQRPMVVLQNRTPEEAWCGLPLSAALPVREIDPVKPMINVTRTNFGGDLELPQLDIQVMRTMKRSA